MWLELGLFIYYILVFWFLYQKSKNVQFTETKQLSSLEGYSDLRMYLVMITPYFRGFSTNISTGYGTCYSPSNNIGNLTGITQALTYIRKKNYNCIWITPIMNSQAGIPDQYGNINLKLDATGYYFQNPFLVDPLFGKLDEYKSLIDKAHSLNIRVIFDIALGHNKGNVVVSPSGLSLPNQLDFEKSETLQYLKEVILYWIENTDIDGFRFDQAYQVPLQAWYFFSQIIHSAFQKKGKKSPILIGEVLCTGNLIYQQGLGTCDTSNGTSLEFLEKNMLYVLQVLPQVFHFSLFFRVRQCLAQVDYNNNVTPYTNTQFIREAYLWAERNKISSSRLVMLFNNHDFPRFGNLLLRSKLVKDANDPIYWLRHKLFFSFLASYSGSLQNLYLDESGEYLPGFSQRLTVDQRCLDLNVCDDEMGRTPGRIQGFTKEEEDLQNFVSQLWYFRQQYYDLLVVGDTTILQSDDVLLIRKDKKFTNPIFYVLNISSQLAAVQLPLETNFTIIQVTSLHQKPLQQISKNYFVSGLTSVFLLETRQSYKEKALTKL